MNNILIIEDEKGARLALAKALEKAGHKIFQTESGEKGIEIIHNENIDIVLCDIKLPGQDGLEVLKQIHEHHSSIEVIMMTAFGTVEKAVRAIKLGALDFLEKPLEIDVVRKLIDSLVKTRPKRAHQQDLLSKAKENKYFEGMIGTGPAMQEVFETIVRVASSRATVLIRGETGTGKELVAKAIHKLSNREGAFMAVNLTALNENLYESELFGHVKGAFTNAHAPRKGRILEADKGTFFMDELGEIPKSLQVKLLRVIEQKIVERVGENIPQRVDLRFVAATHVDLEQAVKEGEFREDLYYRLKVIEIHLPPLREHKEDIPELVNLFIERYSKENARQIKGVSQEALDLLYNHDWPGNVRELERSVEGAVVIAQDGEILQPEHFDKKIQEAEEKGNTITIQAGTPMKEIEKKVIIKTLAQTNGNKTKTAELLGIGTRTLYRKIEEYGL